MSLSLVTSFFFKKKICISIVDQLSLVTVCMAYVFSFLFFETTVALNLKFALADNIWLNYFLKITSTSLVSFEILSLFIFNVTTDNIRFTSATLLLFSICIMSF